jgi:hypothetical protein
MSSHRPVVHLFARTPHAPPVPAGCCPVCQHPQDEGCEVLAEYVVPAVTVACRRAPALGLPLCPDCTGELAALGGCSACARPRRALRVVDLEDSGDPTGWIVASSAEDA